ncbi:hypothetical protein BRADI_3g26252v3 [Brachypodium distachyon]|uniref:Reverse transcriptase zinc-binding domain-containing protein n=1 Tax=Brachypodium distachyon TaxID=15368 RepID=A0A0Q3HT00_BRADI|nr:hypothetical protein BRADI_3g26252v3 [Brachypodium distachyon]
MCNHNTLMTREHLFFRCPFALSCWHYICPGFLPSDLVHQNFKRLKDEIHKPFHMEITTMILWSIWKCRNEFIFSGTVPSLYRCRNIFKEEIFLVFHRAKRKSYVAFKPWIDRFR